MKIETLIKRIEPINVRGSQSHKIKAVAFDSRQVRTDSLFVACQGHQHHGTEFVEEAISRGAVAVMSESDQCPAGDVTHIQVEDARLALAKVSCHFYGNPSKDLQLIGITGTNGKTTTSYIAHAILERAGRSPGLIGTVQYQIGDRVIVSNRTTPEAPELQALLFDMVQSNCQSGVLEVSSHGLDQKRVVGTDFDVMVFTNLTHDHLDYHGTIEKYFESKTSIFRSIGTMDKSATAIINTDDPWGEKLFRMNDIESAIITCGTRQYAQVRAEDVQLSERGCTFNFQSPWGHAPVHLNLLGSFNIRNTILAMASCGALGIPVSEMVEGVAGLDSVPGRLERLRNDRGFNIFIDYAHTHDALKKTLTIVRRITSGKILLVFGCGGNRDPKKRPLMGEIADRFADYSIITSDNPRDEDPTEIAQQIITGFNVSNHYEIELDREKAISKALNFGRSGDSIIIAGKGHETYQELNHTIIPFDDKEFVKQWLRTC
ncbi:MAG: UDP-N-acetylmuramoyl-L-alanyl-D-glutamate--2,6-diaminopimelate ligase [Kiritimatiellae bacterium]|nr:UDP-N-acetylmuramoyl-L-alanyl-D-glutamate--2,6-diaminopimelate ligase [Kiritimatiellia bacterium]